MKVKLQNITFNESKRVGDAATKKANMLDRIAGMDKSFLDQITEMQKRHQLFLECKAEVTRAWDMDEHARVQRFQQSCTAWQSYITEAEDALQETGTDTDEEKVAEPVQAEGTPAGSAATAPAAEAPAAEAATPEVELEEAMEDVTAELEEAAKQETDYGLWAPWSHQDLPEPAKPQPEEATFWMHLATHVFNWSEQHACAPCTYEQLLGPGDPTILMGSVVKLVGIKFWEQIYANKRVVMATDIVPRHMGFVLYCALQKPFEIAKESLGKDAVEKAKENAKTGNKTALKEMKEKNEKLDKKFKSRKGAKAPPGKGAVH